MERCGLVDKASARRAENPGSNPGAGENFSPFHYSYIVFRFSVVVGCVHDCVEKDVYFEIELSIQNVLTVSTEALCVITEVIPINIQIEEIAEYYQVVKRNRNQDDHENRNHIDHDMEQQHWQHPLTPRNQKRVKEAEGKNWKIEFNWIKAHAGHVGNELEDQLAKVAAQSEDIQESYSKTPKSAVKGEIHNFSLVKWQNEWDNTAKGQITKSFFPNINDRASRVTRRAEDKAAGRRKPPSAALQQREFMKLSTH
ncbi:hypothetical protein ANN_18844 [Periplaneta americana]|uniref:RNase H type-1 domain-containing protein n=1 Tax=Periplaneta americana TaxID=6978 RepID=A0ABQ8SPW1_PERAM|nr:hypothetical protein ANN_18844 [Periplaneta americana]